MFSFKIDAGIISRNKDSSENIKLWTLNIGSPIAKAWLFDNDKMTLKEIPLFSNDMSAVGLYRKGEVKETVEDPSSNTALDAYRNSCDKRPKSAYVGLFKDQFYVHLEDNTNHPSPKMISLQERKSAKPPHTTNVANEEKEHNSMDSHDPSLTGYFRTEDFSTFSNAFDSSSGFAQRSPSKSTPMMMIKWHPTYPALTFLDEKDRNSLKHYGDEDLFEDENIDDSGVLPPSDGMAEWLLESAQDFVALFGGDGVMWGSTTAYRNSQLSHIRVRYPLITWTPYLLTALAFVWMIFKLVHTTEDELVDLVANDIKSDACANKKDEDSKLVKLVENFSESVVNKELQPIAESSPNAKSSVENAADPNNNQKTNSSSGVSSGIGSKVSMNASNFQSIYETEFRHLERLGRGGFGQVFKVENRIDGCEYAIKRIKMPNSSEDKRKFMREVKVLASLDHPGIVRYHRAWIEIPPDNWQEERDRLLIGTSHTGNDEFDDEEETSGFTESKSPTRAVKNSPSLTTEKKEPDRKTSFVTFELPADLMNNVDFDFDNMKHGKSNSTDMDSSATSIDSDFTNDTVMSDDSTRQRMSKFFLDSDSNNTESGEQLSFSNEGASFEIEESLASSAGTETKLQDICFVSTPVNDQKLNITGEDHEGETSDVLIDYCRNSVNLKAYKQALKRRSKYGQRRAPSFTEAPLSRDIIPQDSSRISKDKDESKATNANDDVMMDNTSNGVCISQLESKYCYLYIQMQLCSPMSLRHWLETRSSVDSRPPRIELYDIFEQIVDAVEYLHNNSLMHRDLKPSNILFDHAQRIKLADFGLVTWLYDEEMQQLAARNQEAKAKREQEEKAAALNFPVRRKRVRNSNSECQAQHDISWMSTSFCRDRRHTDNVGTLLYMSPEQERGEVYDYKVDVFSLGLIFMELLIPFATAMERIICLTRAKKRDLPGEFTTDHQDESEFVMSLLHPEPRERPTASEILEHQLFYSLRPGAHYGVPGSQLRHHHNSRYSPYLVPGSQVALASAGTPKELLANAVLRDGLSPVNLNSPIGNGTIPNHINDFQGNSGQMINDEENDALLKRGFERKRVNSTRRTLSRANSMEF